MAKQAKVIQIIRDKVMANDDMTFDDIGNAIMNGAVNRDFKDDPRGTRYEIVGKTVDGRTVAVICRIKETGKLLFITTWEVYE